MKFLGAIIVIAIIAAAVFLIVKYLRARDRARRSAVPRDPFAPEDSTYGDPRQLKAGDMVELLGERLFVRGSLRLREGGYQWSEHFIDDLDDTRRWLSVEEDPDLEVVIWTELKDTGLTPNQKIITYDGVEYRRDEHGTAQFASEGTTGLGASGQVEYADFEASKGHYLAFERFDGGRWETAAGERVPPGTLTIYPGGSASPEA